MNSPPPSACWRAPNGLRKVSTRPPGRLRASSTVTRQPASSSSWAHVSPARPAPTTTTDRRGRFCADARPAAGATAALAAATRNCLRFNAGSGTGQKIGGSGRHVRASYAVVDAHWVADAHVDLLIEIAWRRRRGERNPFGEHWLPKLEEGGVRLQVCPIYVEGAFVPDGALRQGHRARRRLPRRRALERRRVLHVRSQDDLEPTRPSRRSLACCRPRARLLRRRLHGSARPLGRSRPDACRAGRAAAGPRSRDSRDRLRGLAGLPGPGCRARATGL
jgi:hypothetical protein